MTERSARFMTSRVFEKNLGNVVYGDFVCSAASRMAVSFRSRYKSISPAFWKVCVECYARGLKVFQCIFRSRTAQAVVYYGGKQHPATAEWRRSSSRQAVRPGRVAPGRNRRNDRRRRDSATFRVRPASKRRHSRRSLQGPPATAGSS